jgi:hypothetical protein
MTPEDIKKIEAAFDSEYVKYKDLKTAYFQGYQAGIQEGMKREHAMWVLAKIGQEIEHVHDVDTSSEHVHKAEENEHEYCDHGIRHNRHCKSCECIEQAEMRSEM